MIIRYLFATTFFLASALAHAGEPIRSPDALEKELIKCLTHDTRSSCMQGTIGKHILPGNEQLSSVVDQMDQLLIEWLDKESVYKVHRMHSYKTGDIYDERSYMIEDSSGAIMALKLSFLNRLGKWYVLKFNINSKSEAVTSVLEEH